MPLAQHAADGIPRGERPPVEAGPAAVAALSSAQPPRALPAGAPQLPREHRGGCGVPAGMGGAPGAGAAVEVGAGAGQRAPGGGARVVAGHRPAVPVCRDETPPPPSCNARASSSRPAVRNQERRQRPAQAGEPGPDGGGVDALSGSSCARLVSSVLSRRNAENRWAARRASAPLPASSRRASRSSRNASSSRRNRASGHRSGRRGPGPRGRPTRVSVRRSHPGPARPVAVPLECRSDAHTQVRPYLHLRNRARRSLRSRF